MDAFSLPKKNEVEKKIRDIAVQEATKNAILIPLKVMEAAYSGFELMGEMAEKGNPNSISDAGVGALALLSCVRGAFLNVRINASGLTDKTFAKEVIKRGEELEKKAIAAEESILKNINASIQNT
jgi:glutamate formiminotransferase/formiminotetrahydrofolate cyclodeaminase